KQSMEDTMLELVKIYQEKEFLCIHDDVDDLIESALNSKLLLINSNSQLYDDDFEDIEYVEASLSDPEIVSVEEENVVQQEEKEERLINLMKNDIPDNSSNNSLLEEVDLFLFDNSIPLGIENFADDPGGEEIPVVMNDKDEDVDKKFSLLSAESEDTIFDLGIYD
nr:hypothetical protein [Tanacetum cinerariifolium]